MRRGRKIALLAGTGNIPQSDTLVSRFSTAATTAVPVFGDELLKK